MCRFLLVKAEKTIKPEELLHKFADMAKKTRAPDGDTQGDGFGVAWIDNNLKWRAYRSLLPIWEDREFFAKVPKTQIFIAHARSATFTHHKGVLSFNQPYIDGEYAFVFNGWLKGVNLPDIPGRIGAEKIWYLLRQELKKNSPQKAMEKVHDLLLKNSREIIALNIGLATEKDLYTLSYFTQFPGYYRLVKFKNKDYTGICSGEFTPQ